MADLYQDLEKLKILFISSYEELLKNGKITEGQFEAVLALLDSVDYRDVDQLKAELAEIFGPLER
ncbi:MAG: hypothetical protein H0Z38_00510 [Firmicutes bacterium]|nr:hypothetical protein [Bacillota bacterium]